MLARALTTTSFVLVLLAGARADEIVKADGTRIPGVTIQQATLDEVQYRRRGINQPQRLSGDAVEDIIYTESKALESARTLQRQGNWQEAIQAFQKAAKGGPLYEEPAAFGEAETYALWHRETGEQGEEAVKALEAYLAAYKDKKGFHVPRALYLLGKASLALGVPNAATKHFDALAAYSGETRKSLSDLGKGEVALAAGDFRTASTLCKQVTTRAKRGNLVTIYRQGIAAYGLALVGEKRFPEAIDLLEKHIKDPQEKNVVFDRYGAQAYNALGDAYAGKGGAESEWEALYRYLWTTVVFHYCRTECAEAFYKAARLAEKLGEKGEADRLLGILRSEFSNTIWAAKAK